MAAKCETSLTESGFPSVSSSDGVDIGQKAFLLLLKRESGKFAMEVMSGVQKRLFPVQDRRVAALRIIVTVEFTGSQREPDTTKQGRMWIGFEIRVNQV